MKTFSHHLPGRIAAGLVLVGLVAGCETAPAEVSNAAAPSEEIGRLASAMSEPDIETVSVTKGHDYGGSYPGHFAWFDWNACIDPFYGKCVDQWGSFPVMCSDWYPLAKPNVGEMVHFTGSKPGGKYVNQDPIYYPETLIAEMYNADFQRFFPGKKCSEISNTRVTKDGGSSCYGGKWTDYDSTYSTYNLAGTYGCSIKSPSAKNVALTYDTANLKLNGSHTFSHPTGATTERSMQAEIDVADDADGSNASVVVSGTVDADLSTTYLQGYSSKYLRYCVKTSFLAEKPYQYFDDTFKTFTDTWSSPYQGLKAENLAHWATTQTVWADSSVCSDWQSYLTPPQATEVSIASYSKTFDYQTWTWTDTATGSYTFTDDDNRLESGSTYAWYIQRPLTDPVLFATTQTATIPSEYLSHDNVKIKFCVTPHDTLLGGAQACTSWKWMGKPSVSSASYSFVHSNGTLYTEGTYTGWSDQISGTTDTNTTFAWKLATDSTGTDAVSIDGESATTHTLAATDEGRYLFFCVSPGNNHGAHGTEVCSSGHWVGPAANAFVPTRSGATVTGSYNFNVNYSVAGQADSTFAWLRASDDDGTDATSIEGASELTHTITAADEGKHLFFCVTPADTAGISGLQACSLAGLAIPTFTAPTASNVTITSISTSLTGSYTYADDYGVSESGTTFQWYRSSTSSVANGVAISGATGSTYTSTTADEGQYVFFCVTPSNGYLTGTKTCSTGFHGLPTASNVAFSATGCAFTGSYTYANPSGAAESGSTFQWYAGSSSAISSASAISGATSQTYTASGSNPGQYLFFCVTPASATSTGAQACSSGVSSFSAPTASSVTISQSSNVLTGSYTFASTCFSDQTPSSKMYWYRNTSQSFTGASLVNSGSSHTGIANMGDQGAYLAFCVTPYDGALTGTKSCSSWFQFVPVASDVTITKNGASLTGSYTFTDYLGYSDRSTKQWYRSSSSSSTGTAITNATGGFWNLTSLDDGKYLTFCVTPADIYTGGTQVCSSSFYVGPSASNVTISGTGQTGQTLTGSYSWSSTYGGSNSGTRLQWKRLQGGTWTDVPTATGSTYTATAWDATTQLAFCVTPSDGTVTGTQVCSSGIAISPTITFYSAASYAGTATTVVYGKGACINVPSSANNTAQSLKWYGVPASTTLTIYDGGSCGGSSATYTASANANGAQATLGTMSGITSSFRVNW